MKASSSLQREFILRNYETDFMQRMKPSSVLGFFQETAGDHSEEMGLGYKSLAEKGCFWVLSKIYVEVMRRPVYGEKIKVVTWPHEPNKAIYERSFLLEDGAGAAMRAYSRWCILQTSGRILPCSRIEQPEIDFREEKSVVFDDWAIPEVSRSGGAAFSLRIANSEYDLNRHVNNIRYADYVFNCFSVKELEEKKLKSFQLHYIKQTHENDLLEMYREEVAPGVFAIEGVKNGDETVVAARVCFE